jgi:hypothetical protein
MEWYDLAEKLEPTLRSGDIGSCIKAVINQINSLPASPFHIIDLEFSNPKEQVAGFLQQFINDSNLKNDLQVVYTETNGFDINPEQWYFELFGYSSYGGLEDIDWLADWQVEPEGGMLLTGMESLQSVYASKDFYKKEYREVIEFSSLLVVLQFQKTYIRKCKVH